MLRDYDIQTYNDMETMLIEYGECCLVGHTGIGKTRISMEFVERYNLNTLVISNRLSINKSWEKTAAENGVVTISTVTIQTFVKAYKMFVDGFDCYIFDEAHHLGANTWFTAYKKFRQIISEECFVIGATATSKRYFDGKGINDITESVFNNHAVYCIDRKEAIELGIISNASYVYALYNVSEYAKEYFDKDMTDELRGKLDFAVKNQPQIADILIKYAPKGNKKGIVYVDRIKSIDDAVQLISTAFPKDPVWYIHSKLPAEEVATVYEEFAKCKNGFIINVDMISEGIHPNDVNMVVMLRKTISPNKFTQQSGRVSNTKGAVIFDFVGNRTSIAKVIARNGVTIGKRNTKKKEQSTSCDNDNHYHMEIVDAYTSDFLSILNEIDNHDKNLRLWTKEDDEYLRQNYSNGSLKEIAEYLGRSISACMHRAGKIGVRRATNNWTEEEDTFLKLNYFTMSAKEIAEYLGRTERTCMHRAANVLKLRKVSMVWSKEEDEYLRQNYPTGSLKEIAEHLGRTEKACKGRAIKIGVRRATNDWTKEEDVFLMQNYSTMSLEKIAEHLERSRDECKRRVRAFGLRKRNDKWTKEEDEFLRQNYFSKSLKEIAKHLHRTETACSSRAKRALGLRKYRHLTQEEDEILMQFRSSNSSTPDTNGE